MVKIFNHIVHNALKKCGTSQNFWGSRQSFNILKAPKRLLLLRWIFWKWLKCTVLQHVSHHTMRKTRIRISFERLVQIPAIKSLIMQIYWVNTAYQHHVSVRINQINLKDAPERKESWWELVKIFYLEELILERIEIVLFKHSVSLIINK